MSASRSGPRRGSAAAAAQAVFEQDLQDAQRFVDRWRPRIDDDGQRPPREDAARHPGRNAGAEAVLRAGARGAARSARPPRATRWARLTARCCPRGGSSSWELPVGSLRRSGSNVGDRRAPSRLCGRRALRGLLDNLAVSRYYETVPVGVSGPQAMFLNAAAVGQTSLAAAGAPRRAARDRAASAAASAPVRQRASHARSRSDPAWAMSCWTSRTSWFRIPRFRERRFVLEPLAEIAPDLKDPATGSPVSACCRDSRA